MSRLCELPVELLDRLISFIGSRKALASLNQTCKLLQNLTEEPLYRSVLLVPRRMELFKSAVSDDPKRKKYIREVDVDHDIDTRDERFSSACTYAPLYATFPNLEILSLRSEYWHWDDDDFGHDPDRVLWDTDQNKLMSLFEEAGLAKPVEERIWTRLQSCTLDFKEMNGQGWYCPFEPAIFLVASLEELTMRGCRFHDGDGLELLMSPYRGQTALKKLVLERSYIHHKAVFNFLTAPKALTHLTLAHDESFWHHEMGNQPSTSKNAQDYMDAFMLHQQSLQYLYMNDEMCDEIIDGMEEGVFNFAAFPKLEKILFEEGSWVLDETKCLRRRDDDTEDEVIEDFGEG